MSREDNKLTLPGERVASIEEFEGGKNTYMTPDGTVRSATVGTTVYDLKRRIVKIEQKNSPMLPKVGDIIVGYVEMMFSSMVSIKVLYINDKWSEAGFSAIASARIGSRADVERRGDRRATFHNGDIVRGRVISLLNSTIHLTLTEKEYGLLYALCFICGGDTVRTSESTIKCVECGAFENRKLAHDYGKESFRLVLKAGK
ncbi:putative RNA-binding protein [Candidatus Nitrososphaera gargensis Ga9.2]|uniref:Exosome complex component Csl4 n=1 Tax=Nitrososphaera gargensis (strain Ga9.2) TaxID=1237085 RepID=K0IKU3_NITGG|nr:exosome complex RNA-binding protein Csl4 [Candidatus Nitrososphaera gargensis]AFU59998.1 putative RNA-binding protein [Candidatus Nitrososphaera gargensis Ga9.2]